jgi:tetratricopeptide (TPR) repeat protein
MTVFGWRARTTRGCAVASCVLTAALVIGCGSGAAAGSGGGGGRAGGASQGGGGGQTAEEETAGGSDDGAGGGGSTEVAAADDDGDPGGAQSGGGGGGSGGGASNGGGKPEPPAPEETERSDSASFKVSGSRDSMSDFLIKPAEVAARKRDWPLALALYNALTVARGPGSKEARQLATMWTLAGRSDEARRVLASFIASSRDEKAVAEARTEYARLSSVSDPFAKQFEVAQPASEAKEAFKRGRAAFKKKAYADALFYFEIGYALAPDLPGFLRELGSTYDQLGAKDKKIEFYRRYLRQRPFGKNADEIRAALGKDRKALGSLNIQSSLPCDEIWLNRQRMPGKLPKKNLTVGPGRYRALCINHAYQIAFWEYTDVSVGKGAQLSFQWAIVVNELKNPYGRISIEDPRNPGTMMDLGITAPEIGVIVPSDGRALRMVLKDDAGSKQVERYIKLQPGQREVIKW